MHIAYLYGQEGSLELEWIRTTLEKEDWTSRLNRKSLTVESRMSPLWELTASCCSKWGLVSSSGRSDADPSETPADARHMGQILWAAELLLNNSLWEQTLPRWFWSLPVLLTWGEVLQRETQEFPHANEKGASKLETNTLWKFKGRDTVMSWFAHL